MKNIFTLICGLIFVSNCCFAQSNNGVQTTKSNLKEFPYGNHNIRVGWSTAKVINEGSAAMHGTGGQPTSYYAGPLYTTGVISAEYTYQLEKWLEIGGVVLVDNYQRKLFDRIDNAFLGNLATTSVGLMFTAKFNYFNKGIWRLYGQVGLGAAVNFNSVANQAGEIQTNNRWNVNFQLTLFGVSVGKKVYGFLELPGLGSIGVIRAGAGIRL